MEKKVVDALAIGYINPAVKSKPRESVGRKGTDPRWNDDRLISWKDRWTDLQDDCRVDANKMAALPEHSVMPAGRLCVWGGANLQ